MSAQELLRAVRARFGACDAFELARRAGATLRARRWVPVTLGECHHADRTIVVNLAAPADAELVVAHELGHLLAGDLGCTLDETEAGAFARLLVGERDRT